MKMDARPPVLGTDALAVEVGRHRVCRDLDFTLQPGDTLVILGRNGAGKSTLLHTLAGLRTPAGGSVLLSGKPYGAWPRGHEACLRGLLALARGTVWFDTKGIDTVVDGSAYTVQSVGVLGARVQSGRLQDYLGLAAALALGIFALVWYLA